MDTRSTMKADLERTSENVAESRRLVQQADRELRRAVLLFVVAWIALLVGLAVVASR